MDQFDSDKEYMKYISILLNALMCVSCRGTVRIGGVDVYESNDVWMCRRMLFSIRICIGKV
jgi:hypothetical protein